LPRLDDIVDSCIEEDKVEYFSLADMADILSKPLRSGILVGDIMKNIYDVQELSEPGMIEFPLDILKDNNEDLPDNK